jgi:hypothetical protein
MDITAAVLAVVALRPTLAAHVERSKQLQKQEAASASSGARPATA